MRSNFQILPLLFIITIAAQAQNERALSLNIGDPAPPLLVSNWLKGEPVKAYEKGKVYVVEFWATWCLPCKAAMPHLSELARKYEESVRIIGMDIMEKQTISLQKIKHFVDSMGVNMNYTVAVQDSNFMETNWLNAAGEQAIPHSFVVNTEGRLAWIGHPGKLDPILPKILNNTWDIQEALAKRNSDRYLMDLEDSLNYELMGYRGSRVNPGDPGNPDLALLAINEIVKREPRLKYAPRIAMHTFDALLKTDPNKAYEYGKVAIVTSTYGQPAYDFIVGSIDWYAGKLKLPENIYRLGAEAYQAQINDIEYPELVNMAKRYNKMAEWYWRANDRSKAFEAQEKAIEMLKNRKNFPKADLAAYESRLQQYRKK